KYYIQQCIMCCIIYSMNFGLFNFYLFVLLLLFYSSSYFIHIH
ncbi:Hypothetical protein EHI5A_185140, partial [Entamoeba histolytica KU27]